MTFIPSPQSPTLDLSSCDREPIHIPGAIQPHGMLIAVDEADLAIVHLSANYEQWLHAPRPLMGRPLDALLAPDSAALLKECLAECTEATSSLRTLQFTREDGDPLEFSVSAHRSGDVTILELERLPAIGPREAGAAETLLGKCRLANHRLAQCEDVEELCQVAAHQVQSLTGYDRVMVYQFDEEWNGAVVAERVRAGVQPYLGLHFPATDIPSIARAIFLLNGLRVIPDAQYQPVPLFPTADPRTGLPLDLSRAHLRSVSPIHLEYLRNMGVRASLTISLVVYGKLWGLIACHHGSPRPVSSTLREVSELLGQMASMQLTERLQAARKKVAAQTEEVLRRLAGRVQQFGSIIPALLADESDLLALVNAQGAAIWRDGEVLSIGLTPPADSISGFHQWVAHATADSLYSTDCLAKQYAGADAHAHVASGMLALTLARSPDICILWFRPEAIQTVDWAGDPGKSKELAETDGRPHPRASFARWKETVRHRSRPWGNSEMEAVKQLRTILQDQLARTAEQVQQLLPICAWCRKVRSDQDYWQQVEEYVGQHMDIRFTHGICPSCLATEMASIDTHDGARDDVHPTGRPPGSVQSNSAGFVHESHKANLET